MSNRLAAALERTRRARDASGGRIIVALSGGKDSLATLDVCVRVFGASNVEAFFMYLVDGLECVERPINAAVRRHGIKLHKVPHWDLARLFKFAVLRPHVATAERMPLLRLRDVEAHLRKATGIGWFAYGERGSDSYARRTYTSKVDGVHERWRRLWPIWDWKTAEVVAYLRTRRIPLPTRIGFDGSRQTGTSGFSLLPESLAWLRKHHPRDFEKVCRVFPFAEAQAIRFERGWAQPISDVYRRTAAPQRGQKRAV